jgi:hypothetical protein
MKQQKRITTSFSFSVDTIKKFESHCHKNRIVKSRLVEDLVRDFLNKIHNEHTIEKTPIDDKTS